VDYADQLAGTLLARAGDESLDAAKRIDAARELVALRANDAGTAGALIELISARAQPELARGMLQAVAASTAPATGEKLATRLPTMTPATRSAGIAILLSRPAWTRSLLEALSARTLQLTDLSLDERRALAEHPERGLRERARKLLAAGGALPNADRRKVLEELLPLAKQTGDAARGKTVFAKQCAKCHVHGGEGTRIGPDLTGMAVHPKEELLEAMIDPSKSVEGNFRVYTLSTTGGQVLTGLLAAESTTAVELFDTEARSTRCCVRTSRISWPRRSR
jgi:putative heme-binding domain-containing protein